MAGTSWGRQGMMAGVHDGLLELFVLRAALRVGVLYLERPLGDRFARGSDLESGVVLAEVGHRGILLHLNTVSGSRTEVVAERLVTDHRAIGILVDVHGLRRRAVDSDGLLRALAGVDLFAHLGREVLRGLSR